MTHRGTTYAADLTPAGKVAAEGKEFASAGAFSLHVKRKTQPGKARDDGWKSVKYRGLPLEHYRKQHVDSARGPQQARGGRRAGDSGDEEMDEDAAPEGAGRGEEAQQGDAPAPAEEDVKWVCCERCQEWRVVPGAHYATIEAAGDAPWFCEMATWDVRTTVPFKPACRG
ncbi:unnamed protein product [Pedinophyceae sp. YPF-701]|nr:unnamed protein product [Pedinophyceae sp. YPF-701]